MFRGFNLENNEVEFSAVLYKNRREKLAIIDNEWIVKLTRNLEDIDSMEIEIPKFVGKDKKFNAIYLKINPMQQIIVEEKNKLGEVLKSRFVLIETTKSLDKTMGQKRYKAMSFEYKLKSKRTKFEGKVMQLISDETHIGEGILDKFVKEVPDWSIDYVDPKSRIETRIGVENVNVDLFNNYTKNNISDGSIIWEKEVITTIANDLPLYLSFEYKNLKTYNSDGSLLITNNIINPITTPLHKNIKKVVARHYSDVGNRFGIEYEFTLIDGVIENRIETFTNIIDKRISCENIKLVWETGKVIENSNIKYINIESIDDSWYNALVQLQDQFNSVVLFDSYEKKLSVIHRDNLGENSGYLLSYDNSVMDIEVTEESSYPNALKVIGKDGLSIANENIYGGDTIYDYSYYIDNGIMSDELIESWNRYNVYLKKKQDEWLVVKNEKMAVQQRKTKIDSEIKSLNERIKNLTNLLAGFIAGGDSDPGGENQARVKLEIDGLKTRLEECLSTRVNYEKSLLGYDDQILKIAKEIMKENATDLVGKIFTDIDLEELRDLEVEEVYDDNYYSTPYGLITHARDSVMKDMIKPQIEFKINCANLAKIITNPKGWIKVLKLGDIFNIEDGLLEEYKVDDGIRLVSYDYIPKDKSVESITFTNKFKAIDRTKSISNISKKSNDSSNVIGSWKNIWEDSIISNNFAKSMREGGLDLNASLIRGRGSRNYIDISECGIFISEQTSPDNSIYIGSNCIGISRDGFKTSDIAIDSNGIIGKYIIGQIVVSEKLYITSPLGEFYIGDMEENEGMGLSISDGDKTKRIFLGTELVDGIRKARLRLIGKDGELALDQDGIISEVQYNDRSHVDPEANMLSYFRLKDNINIIKECILTVKMLPFMTYTKGMESGGISTTTTSSDGGSYSSTSSDGGSYSETKTSGSIEPFGELQESERAVIWSDSSSIDVVDGSTLHMDRLAHRHKTYNYTLPHTHQYILEIPSHSHGFSIPSHNHIFDFDTRHTHQEKYGCFYLSGNENKPSDVSIKVNGMTITQNINSDMFEINIGAYLKKNSLNEIILTSATRGMFHINVYCKSFIRW